MQPSHFLRAGILMASITVLFLVCWEWHWRSQNFPISYNDDEALWSDKRAMVYEPIEKATVFIGSSRIKFDLNIPLWEKLSGNHAIQLAMAGSSPRPVLENLANDPKFKGKLVVDVTEALFFSPGGRPEITPNRNLAYYNKQTPAQKVSFIFNHGLESQLVFLQKNTFSLNSFLERIPIHERTPIPTGPPKFPLKFSFVDFSRETYMSNEFVQDTNMQRQVTNLWQVGFRGRPCGYDTIQRIMNSVKTCVDKIKRRGGQVIFVRTPSSGPYLAHEKKFYPRAQYWDQLLKITGCQGIYFEDYPQIAHFTCPEWSHLKPSDKIVFTNNFVTILRQKGWELNKKETARK